MLKIMRSLILKQILSGKLLVLGLTDSHEMELNWQTYQKNQKLQGIELK